MTVGRWLKRLIHPSQTIGVTPETVDILERLGFYRYADPSQIPRLKKNAIESGDLFGMPSYRRSSTRTLIALDSSGARPSTRRSYFVDAEWLAEDGVLEFLEEIEPFLSNQGVETTLRRREVTDEGYVLFIGDEKHIVYSDGELEKPGSAFWAIVTGRTFSVVNTLLEKAHSEENLFALYGGNDLEAVFLTRDLHRVIIDCPLALEHQPYQTLSEMPWYRYGAAL